MGATGAGNEKGPFGPFLFFGAPKGERRSCARPIPGARPSALRAPGPASLRSAVQFCSRQNCREDTYIVAQGATKTVAPVRRRRCTLSASATTPPHLRAVERPHTGEPRERRTPGQGWQGRTSSEARVSGVRRERPTKDGRAGLCAKQGKRSAKAQREVRAGASRRLQATPGTACMALPRGFEPLLPA